MSIGAQGVKLALEESGELKYLANINTEGTVSYDLTTEEGAEVFTADEAVRKLRELREAEPENAFVIRT